LIFCFPIDKLYWVRYFSIADLLVFVPFEKGFAMTPDFETTKLVGWRAIKLRADFIGRSVDLLGASISLPINVSGASLRPNRPPTMDNPYGLYFWAFDFRCPVVPMHSDLRRQCSIRGYNVDAHDILIAARVSVPAGHYAIVSHNGVARASALELQRIVMLDDPAFDDAYLLARESIGQHIDIVRVPYHFPFNRCPFIELSSSSFFIALPDQSVCVNPRTWQRGQEESMDFSTLRQLMRSLSIIP